MTWNWLELDVLYFIIAILAALLTVFFAQRDSKFEPFAAIVFCAAILLLAQATMAKGAYPAGLGIAAIGTFILYRVVKYHTRLTIKNFNHYLERRERDKLDLFYDRLIPARESELFETALLWAKRAKPRLAYRIGEKATEHERRILVQEYAKAVRLI